MAEDLIQIIRKNKANILIGEIGAFFHDIGKCHLDFIKKHSIEKVSQKNSKENKEFRHSQIDGFLKGVVDKIKNEKFTFRIQGNETNIFSIIKDHHNNFKTSTNKLISLFVECDRLNSASDKGIVREKQPLENTIISSPFGFDKEKIELNCFQKRFRDLEKNLDDLFDEYISGSISLSKFREKLLKILKLAFSHALGETRKPANDVTLWDHSYSTAGLFKSVLCNILIEEEENIQDEKNIQWRILGFCWNGLEFVKKGKKISEILERKNIIEDIKQELKKEFEETTPVGNVIYEDLNGIYFTFPEAPSKSNELAIQCAKIGLETIHLSQPSRLLTVIAKEIDFSLKKRNIPKMHPTLFIQGESQREPVEIDNYVKLPLPKEREDICPICQIRTKSQKEERCIICKQRIGGRVRSWLSKRKLTVWIDEVADKNNRFALVTLNFDISKWLDGTMVRTIYSQSLEDWKNSVKMKKLLQGKQTINKFEKIGINVDHLDNIQLSKKMIEFVIRPDKKDISFKARLLDTFHEIKITAREEDRNYVKSVVNRLKNEYKGEFNEYFYQSLLFTKNPSPARLYRIWTELKDFFDSLVKQIENEL